MQSHSASAAANAASSASIYHAHNKRPHPVVPLSTRRIPATFPSVQHRFRTRRARHYTVPRHRGSKLVARFTPTGTMRITNQTTGQILPLVLRSPSHRCRPSTTAEYRLNRERGRITAGRATVRRSMSTKPLASLLPRNRASLLTTATPPDPFPMAILLRTCAWDPVTSHCHTRSAQIQEERRARRECPPSSRESSDLDV